MNKIHKQVKKGFTLLEVLLTIVVIGILATIVLIAINPNRQISQSRNLTRQAAINDIYNALQQYKAVNRGNLDINLSSNYKEICDTGSLTINDSLPNSNYCDGKIDLRLLVPTYLNEIPKDINTVEGSTGYQLAIDSSNQITIRANNSELNQEIVINQMTVEELIQSKIANGQIIPTSTQQSIDGRLVYTNQEGSQTYIDKSTTTRVCPVGYIPVPGNSMYGTSDFCVMKYEAKVVEVSNPTIGLTTPNTGFNTIANDITSSTSSNGRAISSVDSGYPLARISQINASNYCQNENIVSGAALINNAEWMTIARNIEGQDINWTGGSVGNGGLWRGHSDNSPATALAANIDDSQGYESTGNTFPSIEKRTYALSNGEIIWDLSGNVWEWTDDTISGLNRPNNNSGGLYQEWTVFNIGGSYGTLSYDLTRPSNNTWNSNKNMGQYYAGDVTGTILSGLVRGGRFAADGGLFAMFLANVPTNTTNSFGFRCVVR